MTPINLFSTSTKSRSANVSAQRRLNCYIEQSDDKTSVVAYGIPGLSLFKALGDTPIRGLYSKDNFMYAVHRNSLYKIANDGTATAYALALSTSSGKVCFSDNGLQIIIVDGANGYILTLSTDAFVKITDADFPGADTVCFSDGYFIINKPNTGQFWISASYDGLAWDALDFATAESNPDLLVRVFQDHGQIYLFGAISGEVWVNTGALDFPYSRLSESTFEWGLSAIWSLAKFNNSIIWLARNRQGESQVCTLNGGAPTRVSTFDIENIINGYSTIADAVGFSYIHNGHPLYQLNFPTANKSWLYDASVGMWSQLKSYNINRHRSELSINYIDRVFTSDYLNGSIYKIDDSLYTENGESIEVEIVSKHLSNGLDKVSINEFQVDIETGIGLTNGDGSEPRLMLSISRDNGHTFGNESYLNCGKIGEYRTRARRLRLGIARIWTFKIRLTDNIKKVILGIYIKS